MDKIKLLENSGIKFIGDKEVLKEKNKTLIVVGIARGGTSLVSGALSKLGVFNGDESVAPVFEDKKMANAYESKNFSLAREIISQYNKSYNIWSFKRPSCIEYLKKIDKDCKNPIYLIIFKDIFSIANRNNISMKLDILKGLDKAIHDYKKILNFMDSNSINAFLLSYEKIMQNKEDFINNLKFIIGEDRVSDEQYQAALRFIEPNPKAYLDSTRITKAIGVIDKVTLSSVSGWAKYIHIDKSPEVEVYVNDKIAITGKADYLRKDLKEKKLHPTGRCGFNINLPNLNKGDKVSVKVIDDIEYLKNSNWIVN